MTTIRRFTTDDMFQFNNINLDHLTETYNLNFYLQYLAQWPEYFLVHEAPEGRLTSYGDPSEPLAQLPPEIPMTVVFVRARSHGQGGGLTAYHRQDALARACDSSDS